MKDFADALFAHASRRDQRAGASTQFGYHIIRLDEVQCRPGEDAAESARAEIEARLPPRAGFGALRRPAGAAAAAHRGRQRRATSPRSRPEFRMATGEVAQFTRSRRRAAGRRRRPGEQPCSATNPLSGGRLGGPVALGQDRLVVSRSSSTARRRRSRWRSVRAEVAAAVRQDAAPEAARAAADAALREARRAAPASTRWSRASASAPRHHAVGRGDPQLPVQLRDAAFAAAARRRQAGVPGAVARRRRRGAAAVLAVHPGAPGANRRPTSSSSPGSCSAIARRISRPTWRRCSGAPASSATTPSSTSPRRCRCRRRGSSCPRC